MAEPTLALVLEILQRMQGDMRDLKDAVGDMTRRFGRMERLLADQLGAQVDQEARVDRLAERVDRIERRLDIRD